MEISHSVNESFHLLFHSVVIQNFEIVFRSEIALCVLALCHPLFLCILAFYNKREAESGM